ncbi:unnamed protein product, partial [Staurois parvus]
APSPDFSIKINNTIISPSPHARVLGVILDSHLSFQPQASTIVTPSSSQAIPPPVYHEHCCQTHPDSSTSLTVPYPPPLSVNPSTDLHSVSSTPF